MAQPSYTYLAWTTAILWLLLVSVLMWQVFASDYRAFLHEDAPDLQNMPRVATGELTLVHYLDEQCSCNRFAKPHVQDIEETYKEARHVYPNETMQVKGVLLEDWAISSPAVSIFAPDGVLIYHGPYTAGSVCGQGEDLVAAHLEKWRAGDRAQYLNLLGQGCFCPWTNTNKKTAELT
ncbi:hypothetical protein A3742_13945 [Oleiphilus sp. HI0071]|uniref:DUF6436 domain-containing protein n=1 Tax=unclassified Oleiphilus TaxID=2631174 RepID=UPI0007C33FA1|nr:MULTISPECIES: DUF6436 domain-containing protein [unclassified Oleiphilus]KZY63662.1 hypothetical protein A3737_18230 [Oleiphilus sp. HI0065]KZY79804.1 hypothetical protein A3742_13945 [Oleiphilus sp. HI0071]KZY91937.1 hypothetical protein A3744_03610 [Oleiphilus sp. HI0073]KZZ49887.1 hypothetical protein A3758_13630 [Oleiphilus sp. HI0118]KZZ54182.1 hypothetical protein A3760_33240 [Oleiphilus sp. HI0122]KZZ69759.1 hypothetical protein A3765_03490 [Oleiphilus sp. HI0130]KZZ80607.1 hypothe